MAASWYAIRCETDKEEALWGQLIARGIETFYPRRHIRPAKPGEREVTPYFPGYMFVRVDLEQVRAAELTGIPHAVELASSNGKPIRVPSDFVQALRQRLFDLDQLGADPAKDLKTESQAASPTEQFGGYKGIFDADLPGTERVRLLLEMLKEYITPLGLKSPYFRSPDKPPEDQPPAGDADSPKS